MSDTTIDKTIMDYLDEADRLAAQIEALLEQGPGFEKEKPGGKMQAFYRAIRVVHDNIGHLAPEERARFDALNEWFKNLTGDISRRLLKKG